MHFFITHKQIKGSVWHRNVLLFKKRRWYFIPLDIVCWRNRAVYRMTILSHLAFGGEYTLTCTSHDRKWNILNPVQDVMLYSAYKSLLQREVHSCLCPYTYSPGRAGTVIFNVELALTFIVLPEASQIVFIKWHRQVEW